MLKEILLYTTSGCHLCEEAARIANYLLHQDMMLNSTYKLKLVEIANDDIFLEKYGLRIPVLSVESDELGWPFDIESLESWLKSNMSV